MEKLENPLFGTLSGEELAGMLAAGAARRAAFDRGQAILRRGDITGELGLLEAGEVHVEALDAWGNRTILHRIVPGQIFAETYALCGAPLMADVVAADACRVLFFRTAFLLGPEDPSRPWQRRMLRGLLALTAEKNLAWSARMLCVTAKGIRARVMAFLSAEAARQGSRTLTLPFDRQQMADYLSVERSALSKELGRMRREGLLDYRRNVFVLPARPPEP
ncbi:MAG TPA: Crp/Fnr family transcriptional regulator [Candidatus Fournierella merdigallinarum]|nr:Crp/Fnr family transcriptional regulator [Candidatus Fournierella merdigallinarum]